MKVDAQVRAFARAFANAGTRERADFERGYHKSELRFHGVDAKTIRQAAATFKREHRDLGHDDVIELVEALWASGYFDLRSVALEQVLRRWARDDDFWIRRAAMLARLKPLRRGEGNFELFRQFASPMIEEKEFFIRKAIGWILREVSKKRPALTYAFLDEHVDRVAGLTLREGSKYLPVKKRESLKKRYEARSKR